jgi:hypothetical protein
MGPNKHGFETDPSSVGDEAESLWISNVLPHRLPSGSKKRGNWSLVICGIGQRLQYSVIRRRLKIGDGPRHLISRSSSAARLHFSGLATWLRSDSHCLVCRPDRIGCEVGISFRRGGLAVPDQAVDYQHGAPSLTPILANECRRPWSRTPFQATR